mgnify:CR=1 FL=1
MNTVTGQEISDEIFSDKANTDALDGLLLALAEGNKDDADKFLEQLRKASKRAMYVLSGEMALDDHNAYIEHARFVADVHHAAMM